MLSDEFLTRLERFSWHLSQLSSGGAGGVRRSGALGASAEFSDFREYAAGDDIRRLDWNAYARFDKLFLKLFIEEQEACVTVFLDASASMEEKWETAVKTAEAVSYLALCAGDRTRLLIAQDGQAAATRWFTGRRAWPEISETLDRYRSSGKSGLLRAAQGQAVYPKGYTFLITDGYPETEPEATISYLRYRGQSPVLLQVLSAFELHPDAEGALRLTDAESGDRTDLIVDIGLLRQYEQSLRAFLSEIRELCKRQATAYALIGGNEFESAFLQGLAGAGMIE
ncbi:MAG: DUF58 domain-containing protein [Clostridia bacterium]|nr:DUF58 domain-containing protein [Clostridia bacterium]